MSALTGTWYSAKSWLTTWPNRGSISPFSCNAIPTPIVMPPMNCERAVRGLTMRPAEKTPSMRSSRISPVSSLMLTCAKCAPNECIATSSSAGFSPASACDSAPGAGSAPCSRRNSSAARRIAAPQLASPVDPPATVAFGRSVSPIPRSICSTGTPSPSAATWASTVQVPVPMSAAPMSTR